MKWTRGSGMYKEGNQSKAVLYSLLQMRFPETWPCEICGKICELCSQTFYAGQEKEVGFICWLQIPIGQMWALTATNTGHAVWGMSIYQGRADFLRHPMLQHQRSPEQEGSSKQHGSEVRHCWIAPAWNWLKPFVWLVVTHWVK